METLTKNKLQEIRKDIDNALLAVAQKHGLGTLQALKAKYDPDRGHFTFALEGVVAGGMDERAFLYSLWANVYGWPDIFSEFNYRDEHHKIIGCNKTKTKIYCQAGELTYEFHPDLIKRIFESSKLKSAASK